MEVIRAMEITILRIINEIIVQIMKERRNKQKNNMDAGETSNSNNHPPPGFDITAHANAGAIAIIVTIIPGKELIINNYIIVGNQRIFLQCYVRCVGNVLVLLFNLWMENW